MAAQLLMPLGQLLGEQWARLLNKVLQILAISHKPDGQASSPVVSRFVQAIDTVRDTHELPLHVAESDFFKTRNGGWVSNIPATADKDTIGVVNSFTYTADDPVVRVDYTYYFNGHIESTSGAGDGATPFPVPFEWQAMDSSVSKEYASRGSDSYHASREPSTFNNRAYIRAGGASIQNWRIVFDEPYEQILISEITNCSVRFDVWDEPELSVGAYQKNSNKIWVSGNHGAVAFRFEPQKKHYTQDFGTDSVALKTDKVGLWKCVTELTYQSGFVESYTHEYEVTGDASANYSDIELVPGGWAVATPIYKEQWQAIKEFWDSRDTRKAAAVEARIDAAQSTPTSASHPNDFALNAQTSPPADIQLAIDIVTTGVTALTDGVSAFESLAGSNPVQAALNELNHYGQIMLSWKNLAETTNNANLKGVASANRQFTANLTQRSRFAHNGWVSFDEADAGWKLYEQYSAWAIKQTPNELQNMEVWDLVLGRPNN